MIRPEPGAVRWFRKAAEQGATDAKFKLGCMYATGEGVFKDDLLEHMWSNIAGAKGHANARKNRDSIECGMTRSEIRRATELAHACKASEYQDCQQE